MYLKIDKSEQLKNTTQYKEIDVETFPTYSYSSVPISETSNLIGYLDTNQKISNYTLRNSKNNSLTNFLVLEFSSFNDSLDVKIEGKPQSNVQPLYGKYTYFIETANYDKDTITLSVERRNYTENALQFFYYKYTFSNGTNEAKYKLTKTNLVINKTENGDKCDYNIKLTPVTVDDVLDYNVTYIVKLNNDQNIPKSANLVLKLKTKYLKEFYNPKLEEGETKLSFDIKDVSNDITYIEVMAQIQIAESLEYIAYDPQTDFTGKDIDESDSTESSSSESEDESGSGKSGLSKGTIAIIVISCIVVVIIIVIIIIVIVYNKRKKKLRDKVEEISFAEADKKEDAEEKEEKDDKEDKGDKEDKEVDDDLLLNKDEDNN